MKRYDVVIGIDPDVDKSGVAYLETESRILEATCLTFADLLDYLRKTREVLMKEGRLFVVVVEAGWLNKAHWHVGRGGNAARSALIGNHTGRNHEVGRKIVEMCRHYGIEVVEQPPLRKIWKGRDSKHGEARHKGDDALPRPYTAVCPYRFRYCTTESVGLILGAVLPEV